MARNIPLEDRLAAAVARRLQCDVVFLRWIPRRTGDVPVFRVPSEHVTAAQALGLAVEPSA